MVSFNVSATLNVFRVLVRPGLCLPHATVSTFDNLPVPLNRAFEKYGKVDIRAVVLDKDDCFARPNENEVYKPYRVGERSHNILLLFAFFFVLGLYKILAAGYILLETAPFGDYMGP
jgi:hypothetical protein